MYPAVDGFNEHGRFITGTLLRRSGHPCCAPRTHGRHHEVLARIEPAISSALAVHSTARLLKIQSAIRISRVIR